MQRILSTAGFAGTAATTLTLLLVQLHFDSQAILASAGAVS